MKWIDYSRPGSLDEAIKQLADGDGKARPLAGGTDLIVMLRAAAERVGSPDLVVDVKNVPELNEICYDDDDGLTLGAAVECYRIYSDETIACKYPGLTDAATLIGGIQIQGRASIGGNLCNAAPSGDSIPALIALGATANVTGPNGSRQVAVEDFCTGPGRNVLEPGELLVSISIPAPKAGSGARYIRFIPRNEMDIAVAGAGVSVEIEDGDLHVGAGCAGVGRAYAAVRAGGGRLAGGQARQRREHRRGGEHCQRGCQADHGHARHRGVQDAPVRGADAPRAEHGCRESEGRRVDARQDTRTDKDQRRGRIEFLCEPRQSLLECLRDIVGLTGSKEGCNDGNCGACTVSLDGRIVTSCLVLGVEADGAEVNTIEGVASPDGLHPIQQAFLENAALQCGICTPGFIVATKALLEQEPTPSEHRIRFWLAGNLCRCTGYDKIVRAVMDASDRMAAAS